jgi:hypothetical protein
MSTRLASTLTVAAALVTAASAAQAETSRPLNQVAKGASDAFVRALVVKRDLPSARRYTSKRFTDLQKLHAGFAHDGVDTVAGASRIVRGCRATQHAKPSPRGDCVLYHLRGHRRANGEERRTDADFKIWLRLEMGSWKVWAYDYSALVTVCPTGCR